MVFLALSRGLSVAISVALLLLPPALVDAAPSTPKAYPVPPQSSDSQVIDSQTACANLAGSVPLLLASLPKNKYTQPLQLSNVITRLYAEGDHPSTKDLLRDIPAAAFANSTAGNTPAAVASSVGDWGPESVMADMGYGLEGAVQNTTGGLPSFCRFGASIQTSNTSATWFEAWMPVPGSSNSSSNASNNTTSTAAGLTGGRVNSSATHDGQPSADPLSMASLVEDAVASSAGSAEAVAAGVIQAVGSVLSGNITGGASRDAWRGRLVFVGSSAQRGAPSYPDMKQTLTRYHEATASSNLGHWGTGTSAEWTVGNPEQQFDFGYRGTHVAAIAAQYVVKEFYNVDASDDESGSTKASQKTKSSSSPPAIQSQHLRSNHSKTHDRGGSADDNQVTLSARATSSSSYSPRLGFPVYYRGCSTGGRQGMVEAQRFPYDFDGVIAGAPAVYYNELNAYQIHVNVFQGNSTFPQYIPPSLYAGIHSFIMQQCDGLDGKLDAVIEDVSVCKPNFDLLLCGSTATSSTSISPASPSSTSATPPSSTASSSAPTAASASSTPAICLTPAQRDNLVNIYTDYKYPNGTIIHEAVQYGSESYWTVTNGVTGTPFAPAPGWFQYQVLNISGTPDSFNYTAIVDNNFTLVDFGHRLNPGQTQSDNADLRRFFGKGGKLLHYHGGADQLIPSGSSDRFYRAIKSKTSAGLDSYRYYHIPGMTHCRGGDGPWNFGGGSQTIAGSRPYQFSPQYDMLLAMFDWVEKGSAPKTLYGAGYKFTTDAQPLNATSAPTDVQTFAKGLKYTHRLCPYPRKNVLKPNQTVETCT